MTSSASAEKRLERAHHEKAYLQTQWNDFHHFLSINISSNW